MILTEGQLLFRLQDFQGAEKDALAIGDYEFAQESADIANALRELLQARRTIQELTAVVEQRNGECVRLHSELESRTVKLPKPHAHLIWIQAGHAPDDYWDDVAVSHSEKDRCCDGSERYPVYARWEIEEMLTATGIKWEAE